jgi:hypothetical protein
MSQEKERQAKNLHMSILQIAVDLQKSGLKKSGYNAHLKFYYFELGDFLPTLTSLMLDNGVGFHFTVNGSAALTLVKGDERLVYEMPVPQISVQSMKDIQTLGAINTYCKRYLFTNAFNISDGDVIDAMHEPEKTKLNGKPPAQQAPAPSTAALAEQAAQPLTSLPNRTPTKKPQKR